MSFFRRAMVYLGLVDDDYDDYEPYDDSQPVAPALVDGLRELGLDVQGLMGLGPLGDPEAARPGFKKLVALADELALPVRSIGMSDDLEVAVQEGSTMVRIGRALFGPRSEPSAARR